MRTIAREFSARDLVGGHPALDFVNTVTARNSSEPVDWLDGFDRLVEWTRLAGGVDAAQAAELRRRAATSPARARAALARAKELREVLHGVLGHLVADRPIPVAALKSLDAARKAAVDRTALERRAQGVRAELALERSGLDFIADWAVLTAVDLLAEPPRERTRLCPGANCGWLFVDTSKGGQRVWCDMATCGNAAKSQRHQKRLRRRGKTSSR